MLSLWAPVNVPDALGLHATCLPPGDLALAAARHPQVRQDCRAGAVWGCVVMGGEGLPTRRGDGDAMGVFLIPSWHNR